MAQQRWTLGVLFLLAWVLGVGSQLQQAALWSGSVYVALCLLGIVLLWVALAGPRQRSTRRASLIWPSLCVGAALLAGWGLTGARAVHYAAQALPEQLQGVDVVVVGRVVSLPQRTAFGDRFVLAVDSASQGQQAVKLPSRVQLSWPDPTTGWQDSSLRGTPSSRPVPVQAGEHWRLTVRLRKPHGPINPHGFDRERWMWDQGLGATGYVRQTQGAVAERLQAAPWYAGARQRVKTRIEQQVPDARSAGVLAALVVGDQSAVDRSDWDLFRTTGVAHLVSISGLHVTMFAWLATLLVGRLWRCTASVWPQVLWAVPAQTAAALGGVGLAGAYALFSGWGVPSQRTVLMLAVMVGLRLCGRRWPWPVVWLLGLAAVVLLDPWALLQAGFWLSFVAVGILFAADPSQRFALMAHAPASSPKQASWAAGLRHMGATAFGLLREQWLLTVALAPLSLFLFGQFSVVGLVANLFAVPWVTLVITPLAMLGAIAAPLWDGAALAVQCLVWVLQWFAQWPMASVYRAVPPTALAVGGVLGGVLLMLRLPALLRLGGLLLLWPVFLWRPPDVAHGQFELLALDVGQGSAVLVRTAQHALLYDSGPRYSAQSDAGDSVVVPVLRALGQTPQTIVVSHRDSDHAGGMQAVRSAWPQARWLSSFDEAPEQRCLAGQRWRWDGVDFEILHPSPQHYDPQGNPLLKSNAMSCVLRISTAQQSAWLSGDLDAAQETRLALARPDLRAHLMLAPHHGSLTSSSPVLLNTLRPRWVIIQSGYRNRYNHPAPAVIERYQARAIRWVNTPDCGAATWHSAQPDRVHCQRQVMRRYWHHTPAPAPL